MIYKTGFFLDDKEIEIIELKNNEVILKLLNIGASIKELYTRDHFGIFENIVLGFENLYDYIDNDAYFGATVGPNAGRIENSKMLINDYEYTLENTYKKVSNLHSGSASFAFKVFDYKEFDNKVEFTYHHNDSLGGFPGNICVKVTYTLNKNILKIEYEGTSDKDTVLNITNHSYFNLSGNAKDTVLNDKLYVNASKYGIVDKNMNLINFEDVSDTPFDFREEKVLNQPIKDLRKMRLVTKGLDNTFNLDGNHAVKYSSVNGRILNVYTSYPNIVIYSGNFPCKQNLLNGNKMKMHDGICFECQYQPNSINKDQKALLKKDTKYYNYIEYHFN